MATTNQNFRDFSPIILPGFGGPSEYDDTRVPMTEIHYNTPFFNIANPYNASTKILGVCLYAKIGPVDIVNERLYKNPDMTLDQRHAMLQEIHDTRMRHLETVRGLMHIATENSPHYWEGAEECCDFSWATSFMPENWVKIRNASGEDIYAVAFLQILGEPDNVMHFYRMAIRILTDSEDTSEHEPGMWRNCHYTDMFHQKNLLHTRQHDHNIFYNTVRHRTFHLFYTRNPENTLQKITRSHTVGTCSVDFFSTHQTTKIADNGSVRGSSLITPFTAQFVQLSLDYDTWENDIRREKFLQNIFSDPMHSHIYAETILSADDRNMFRDLTEPLVGIDFEALTGVKSETYRVTIPVNLELDIDADGGKLDLQQILTVLYMGMMNIPEFPVKNRIAIDASAYADSGIDISVKPGRW